MTLAGHDSRMRVMGSSYDILGRNPEEKVPLEECDHGLKNNIKM
jgi:hypothetical protein